MSSVCASVPKFFSKNCNCHDNAALPLACSLIPIVGPVIQLFKEFSIGSSINQEILTSRSTPKIVELIKLKNTYKICGLVRDCISVAISITLLVLGLLSPAGAWISAIGFGVAIGSSSWALYKNQTAIKVLEDPKNNQSPLLPTFLNRPRVTVY
jgi:hypothetical protein